MSQDADERYEELIAFLGSQLSKPVQHEPSSEGALILTGGAPPEVIVHLDESMVVVSEYAGAWKSSERFVVRPRRIGLLKWRTLPETALMDALAALIKGAREMRLARYRPCTVCGEKTPPESLFAEDVCEECLERSREVVH